MANKQYEKRNINGAGAGGIRWHNEAEMAANGGEMAGKLSACASGWR